MSNLLFVHVADVTPKPGSVILMEVPPQENSEMGNKSPLPIVRQNSVDLKAKY